MATIIAKVNYVKVSVDKATGELLYTVVFDRKFDAIVRDINNNYVDGQANQIAFKKRVIISQCMNTIAGFAKLYNTKKEAALLNGQTVGFGAAELDDILRGATVTMERSKGLAGDEYVDSDGFTRVRQNDGYFTSIEEIELREDMQTEFDAFVKRSHNLFKV